MKKKLQIRDIVKASGIDRETLRFYEQKGLLPKPERTDSGYRLFDEQILARLKFIKLAQEVGFTLKEISELLNLGQSRAVSKSDLQAIADQKIEALDERIRSLKSMRKMLVGFSQAASRISKNSECLILSQFQKFER